MADRNHLHVCRDCGNVMATSSAIGPRKCSDCGDDNFSLFLIMPKLIVEQVDETPVTWRLYGDYALEVGLKEATVRVEGIGEGGPTVRDALNALFDRFPELREVVMDDGQLVDYVHVVHNHVDVYNELGHLETEVRGGDELALFSPVGG